MRKSINRKHKLFWVVAQSVALAFLLATSGCGGGGNSERATVFITADVEDGANGSAGNFIEVEMLKSVEASTGLVTVLVESSFPSGDIEPSVGSVILDRYELTFERIDGGSPNLASDSGLLGGAISLGGNAPVSRTFEFPIVSTFQKVYGPFGQAFRQNPSPVEFRVTMKIFAHNLAGDQLTAQTGFAIECAVFNPVDELIPGITSFNYSESVVLGNDWVATWATSGSAISGSLLTPFGDSVFLDGGRFPFGSFRQDTDVLLGQFDDQTSQITYPPALLSVSNFFGSTSSQGSGNDVIVTNPDTDIPTGDSVNIENFFASRYNLTLGESTTLTWDVSGGPTMLGILPTTYSGTAVDFSGRDLAFDSVTVVPDSTVRPILRAFKESNQTEDTEFLAEDIVVTGGGGATDPTIEFFTVSHGQVPRYQQVAFFWKISGDYEKVELLPINGQAHDVTGRESFLSPPLNRLGSNTFTLAVTGVGGGPIVTANVAVTVAAEEVNQPVEITILDLVPGMSIDNGDSGAFSFRIDDPENKDSSWTVFRIAGDSAIYGPSLGLIPDGHGDATVTFNDGEGSLNGFIAFEISGYDTDDYGYSARSNRTVELVTFNTNGRTTDNAPTIEDVTFTPGNLGTGLLPGQDGVLSFTIADPDTNDLRWEVEIIAGDRGGTLNDSVDYTSGATNNGRADVAVQYEDDPDSTDDAVVFLITATEVNVGNPQSTSVVFRVDYLIDTDGTISFAHNGMYNNGTGTIDAAQRISFYLNYDGTITSAPGAFFVDHNLTIPAPLLSVVMDMQHGSTDPGRIADLEFQRDFIIPLNDNENFGELLFGGYFASPGEETIAGAQPSPPTNGVSRWYFVFDVESFHADTGGTYNLPVIDGQKRNYIINVMAFDEDNTQEDLQLLLTVEAVN